MVQIAHKLLGFAVEAVEAATYRADPECAGAVFGNCADGIAGDAGWLVRIMLIMNEAAIFWDIPA